MTAHNDLMRDMVLRLSATGSPIHPSTTMSSFADASQDAELAIALADAADGSFHSKVTAVLDKVSARSAGNA